jgi:hypothetical protein
MDSSVNMKSRWTLTHFQSEKSSADTVGGGRTEASRQPSQILYQRQPPIIWSTSQRVVEFSVGSDHSPVDGLG